MPGHPLALTEHGRRDFGAGDTAVEEEDELLKSFHAGHFNSHGRLGRLGLLLRRGLRHGRLQRGRLVLEAGGGCVTPIGVRWLEGINFLARGANVAIAIIFLVNASINQSIIQAPFNSSQWEVYRLATRCIFLVVLFVVCSSVEVKILCSSSLYLSIHVYCTAGMFPLVCSFWAVRWVYTVYKLTPFSRQ